MFCVLANEKGEVEVVVVVVVVVCLFFFLSGFNDYNSLEIWRAHEADCEVLE